MWAHGKGHVFLYQFVYIQFNKVVPSHSGGVSGLKNETVIIFSLRIILRRKIFEFHAGRYFPYMLFDMLNMDS